jgi:hypothetical protein
MHHLEAEEQVAGQEQQVGWQEDEGEDDEQHLEAGPGGTAAAAELKQDREGVSEAEMRGASEGHRRGRLLREHPLHQKAPAHMSVQHLYHAKEQVRLCRVEAPTQ